jgi:hypothetical protein
MSFTRSKNLQGFATCPIYREYTARSGSSTVTLGNRCRPGKLIGGLETLNLPDGNRVHVEPIDCLIGFGQRWRSDAQAALLALGLKPPEC